MIMALLCINLNVNAQQDLQNFINEFKSSIELPEYYNGKQLMARTPYEVRNMYIKNGILFFQYTTGNQSYTSNYSVEIDLNKVEIKKELILITVLGLQGQEVSLFVKRVMSQKQF